MDLESEVKKAVYWASQDRFFPCEIPERKGCVERRFRMGKGMAWGHRTPELICVYTLAIRWRKF